jgi:hypothetical protein
VPGRAGETTGDYEETLPEGLHAQWGLTKAQPQEPSSQVVSKDLKPKSGGVGGEPARRQVIETEAVLEIPDGVLDVGVAAMVGFKNRFRRVRRRPRLP